MESPAATPRVLPFFVLIAFIIFQAQVSVSLADEGRLRTSAAAPRKLRVLAFHGVNQSAAIFQEAVSTWDPAILDLLDFTFLNGWIPQGHNGLYGWYEELEGLVPIHKSYERSVALTLDYMEKNGPFDGLIGHSQGSVFAGSLAAIQERGKVIMGKSAADLPALKFFICNDGFHLRDPVIADLIDVGPPLKLPSLHIIGLQDFLRPFEEQNLQYWQDPVVIYLPQGHHFPTFGDEDVQTVVRFLKNIQGTYAE